MASSLYTTGHYLALHPTWHVEDSAWKAAKVLHILKKNNLSPQTVCEVGCGAGEVLVELQKNMPSHCMFLGAEVSPQAHAMCLSRANDRLSFVMDTDDHSQLQLSDVVLALDVVEHVDDYRSFLKQLGSRGRHCVIHMPLDLSVQSILRGVPQKVRKSAGHIHYFTKGLFLDALAECGFTVIDWMYTAAAIERPSSSLPMALAKWPRKILFEIHNDAAALVLGGYSLLVLAARTQS